MRLAEIEAQIESIAKELDVLETTSHDPTCEKTPEEIDREMEELRGLLLRLRLVVDQAKKSQH